MASLPFSTPALQQDFPNDPAMQQALDALWNTRVAGFTQQAIVGNPWTGLYQANQTSYYDPTNTEIGPGTAAVLVEWTAFPNRLIQYLGVAQNPPPNPHNLSDDQILELADTGGVSGKVEFALIPENHCPQADWSKKLMPYGPYGPRGWLDEYCEWSVTRNADNKIVRVDFVCENPEYWYSLWQIDPAQAATVYEQTLNAGAPSDQQISVTVEDLQLVAPHTGNPVIDPSTGRPAYNPLNKWNTGTVSMRTGSSTDSGGAMHLTSTPNTLQTELALAGGASVLRQGGNSDPQKLICCGQYGQSYRNSDPHIGQQVNVAVATPAIVSLADPVGLYIQPPSWDLFDAPDGRDPSDCWQVVRGSSTLTDPVTGEDFPGSFILHVAFQIPDGWPEGMTVEDVTINGAPIKWAGQIAQTFHVGLFPRPIGAPQPEAQPCVGTPVESLPQPLQLFFANLWDAYYATDVTKLNPVGQPMSLASSTVIVPPQVPQGASAVPMALTCAAVTDGAKPTITFSGDGVEVSNVSVPSDANYTVPGNSYPGDCQLVTFELSVDEDAAPGVRSISLADAGAAAGEAAPAFLEVLAAS